MDKHDYETRDDEQDNTILKVTIPFTAFTTEEAVSFPKR